MSLDYPNREDWLAYRTKFVKPLRYIHVSGYGLKARRGMVGERSMELARRRRERYEGKKTARKGGEDLDAPEPRHLGFKRKEQGLQELQQ